MAIGGDFFPGRSVLGTQVFTHTESTQSAKASMAAILSRYESLIRNMKGITPVALRDALQPAFNKSQVYVPKKTGALMESGQLNVFPSDGETVEAEIVYGSDEAWYAALIHESVWLNHVSPTRSKYLQAAMEEELDAFLVSVAVDYAMGMG